MSTCVRGYPTITESDVYKFFGGHGLFFEWEENAPKELTNEDGPVSLFSNFYAFKSAVEMLYTAEGLIFVTFKKREDRPYVKILDSRSDLMYFMKAPVEGVMVYPYYFMENDGSIQKKKCLEVDTVITKEYFEKEVRNQLGFRDSKYENNKFFEGGTLRHYY
jgi:hypothetical protein